jgi:hypothetical protein
MSVGSVIEFKDGKLVTTENGKMLEIGSGDIPKEHCFTTQFKGSEQQCLKFMEQLADDNQNVDEMMVAINDVKDSAFANIVAEGVSKMDPRVARRILDKFGIQIITIFENGKHIQKYESIDSWLARILKVVKKDPQEALHSSTKLKQYLGLIISFINANPVVLNSGALDAKEPVVEDKSYLQKVGIQMLPRIPMVEMKQPVDSVIKRVAEATRLSRLLHNTNPLGIPVVPLPRYFAGGGINNVSLLKNIISGLINDLSSRGKKLRQKDVEKINEHLANLEKLDKVLGTLAEQLRQYREWTDIIGDTKQEVVSDGSIRNSLDKYQTCASKYASYENGILKVAIKLSEECSK